jgi:uncharacterized protein YozE (UPF0346 family)
MVQIYFDKKLFFSFTELDLMPVGPGDLFVISQKSPKKKMTKAKMSNSAYTSENYHEKYADVNFTSDSTEEDDPFDHTKSKKTCFGQKMKSKKKNSWLYRWNKSLSSAVGEGAYNLDSDEEEKEFEAMTERVFERENNRKVNPTEKEESVVVQFLALGGHRDFLSSEIAREKKAFLTASSVHAGPGQMVWGWNEKHFCDLALFFEPSSKDEPTKIFFHNYHGEPWHCSGHKTECRRYPTSGGVDLFVKSSTTRPDSFRHELATAWTIASEG